jgi:hypothetical protein
MATAGALSVTLGSMESTDPDDQDDAEEEIPFEELIWLSPRHHTPFL